jgi:hypothetical protein
VLDQFFNKVKPEFVDTPARVGYKGYTSFKGHTKQKIIKIS